jgi:hypothetical protein
MYAVLPLSTIYIFTFKPTTSKFCGPYNTIQKDTETASGASQEVGLEANTETDKHIYIAH